ncbi:phospholipase D zeta 1-like protein [Tanacetum coccineum]
MNTIEKNRSSSAFQRQRCPLYPLWDHQGRDIAIHFVQRSEISKGIQYTPSSFLPLRFVYYSWDLNCVITFTLVIENKAPNEPNYVPQTLCLQQHMVIPHYMGSSKEQEDGKPKSSEVQLLINRQDSFTSLSAFQEIPLLIPQEADIEPSGPDMPMRGFADDRDAANHMHGKSIKSCDKEWWETQERASLRQCITEMKGKLGHTTIDLGIAPKKLESYQEGNVNEVSGRYQVLVYTYFQGQPFKDATLDRGSIVTTQTTILYGEYEEIDCYVKQGKVEKVGDYLNSFHIQRKVQEQDNMLRIYESLCDGVDYQTTMERCSEIYKFMDSWKINYSKLKKIVRGIIRAMIHLHDKGIVHGRIRPQHIFVKEYESISQVAKLGGISGCRKVTELDKEPFTRDIYDMGRTISDYLTTVRKSTISDPLVGHLIKQCLTCEVSAKEMFKHFCFYEDGTYLEFMKRFNDTVKVNQQLWDAIETSQVPIVGSGWKRAFTYTWLKKIGGVIRTDGQYKYSETHLDSHTYSIKRCHRTIGGEWHQGYLANSHIIRSTSYRNFQVHAYIEPLPYTWLGINLEIPVGCASYDMGVCQIALVPFSSKWCDTFLLSKMRQSKRDSLYLY